MDIKTTNHFRQLLLKLQGATEELEVISKDSGKSVAPKGEAIPRVPTPPSPPAFQPVHPDSHRTSASSPRTIHDSGYDSGYEGDGRAEE